MPLWDFICQDCEHEFEALVRGETAASCPKCESENLERQMALPRVKSDTTRGLAMRAAKKRDAKGAKDRMHERLAYEHSHDRHG